MRPLTLGHVELCPVLDGYFSLDGGAMFGVVPRVLWEKTAPPDARHRVRLALRAWLVRGGGPTILIDAGVGDKMSAKAAEMYGFDRARHLDQTLGEIGLSAADVDLVIASHLHFDHAGGFTTRGEDGGVRPRFPNARYVVRRGEWQDATHPHERNRGSYVAENFVPLADAGVVDFVDEDAEVVPGVRLRVTGGHTRHHQMIEIASAGRTAVFVADLIPTRAHVPLPWIMGYDLYPMDTLTFKRAFLREAVEREHLLLFEHDPDVAAGYLRERGGTMTVEAAI